jgi:hypothetical protein
MPIDAVRNRCNRQESTLVRLRCIRQKNTLVQLRCNRQENTLVQLRCIRQKNTLEQHAVSVIESEGLSGSPCALYSDAFEVWLRVIKAELSHILHVCGRE